MQGIPNNLDILFCRDEDVIYMDEFGKELRSMRYEFISKALKHKFGGYAYSQLQKLLTKGRNGTGRQELVEEYGYDTKMSYHGIRLLESAIEILETGHYNVYRQNHEELVAIRNGKYTLEEIVSIYQDLDNKLNTLYETSDLKHSCDFDKINNWLIDLNRRALDYNWEDS